MRRTSRHIDEYRVREGPHGTPDSFGLTGAFWLPLGVSQQWVQYLFCIASDGLEWPFPKPAWEHVSVTAWKARRGKPVQETMRSLGLPTWEHMSHVRNTFWRPDETVIQLHVPKHLHVNFHETCLHLWRPVGVEIPLPPKETLA